MRVLGFRVPSRMGRFIRRKLPILSTWVSDNILFIGLTLLVRSRCHETPASITHLSGGAIEPTKLVGLKVWRPWWRWRTKLDREHRPLTILSCQPFGRWGNRVVQAATGVAAAKVFGATQVLLRSDDFLDTSSYILDNQVVLAGIRPHHPQVPAKVSFPRMGLIVEANWLLSDPSFRDRRNVINGFRSLRRANTLVSDSSQRHAHDLVIHFRGTDQLSREWRPPPLSFFLLSAIHSKARTVKVVTDDPQSSLVAGLLRILKQHGFLASVQSSSLREDIATIHNASTVCIGIGTFASSIVALSHCTRIVYSWKQPDWSYHGDIRGTFDLRTDIQNFRIEDATNTYVLPFARDAEFPPNLVRKHMEEFPMNNLKIVSIPGID